jgi:ribosomal protein S19E (S16A)
VTGRAFGAAELAAAVTRHSGQRPDRPIAEAFLRAFEAQGLVERVDGGYVVTEAGWELSDGLTDANEEEALA